MDANTQKKIEQITGQMSQEIKTLQDLVQKVDSSTQSRKAVAEKAIASQKKRTMIFAGAIVAAVAIICLSLLGAWNSGAGQRKLDSATAASIKTAEKYIEDGDYDEAIALMEEVPEDATKYSDAQYVITKANEGKENAFLEDANVAAESGDYRKAITILQTGIDSLEETENIQKAQAENVEKYITEALNKAQESLDAGDYQAGLSVLDDTKTFLLENVTDADLSLIDSKIEEIQNASRSDILSQAKDLHDQGNYSEEVELLTSAASLFEGDEEIESKLEDVTNAMVLEEVTQYSEAGSDVDTIKYINGIDEKYQDLPEVNSIYSKAVSAYESSIIQTVTDLVGQEKYSEAKTVLEEALEVLPGDEVFTEQVNLIDSISIQREGFSGSMENEEQEDSFEFVAPVTGNYRFDLETDNANTGIYVSVLSPSEERLAGDSLYGGRGLNAQLEANQTYTVYMTYYDGTADYTVKIGMPSPTVEVSDFENEIEGSITYDGQSDRYHFITSCDGRYRFEINDDNASAAYTMKLIDNRNNELFSEYLRGGSGKTINLDADTEYTLIVGQDEETANYRIKIWAPNPVEEIDNTVNEVTGSLKYIEQLNRYVYTAPISGRYRISSEDNNANSYYKLYIYDERDEELAGTDGLKGGEGLTVDLEEGKTYWMNLIYNDGLVDYTLTFGVPNPVQEISSDAVAIIGEIRYVDQLDAYTYVPQDTYTYLFTNEGGDEDWVRVLIYDSRDNQLVDSTIGGNQDFRVDLEAGETYTVYVRYADKLCDYNISIGRYVEE